MKSKAVFSSLLFFLSWVLFLTVPFSAIAQPANREAGLSAAFYSAPNAKWLLHAIPVSGGYLLAETETPNKTGRITLPANGSALWIDNRSSGTDTRYEPGNWYFDIITDKDWGQSGSACEVDLGFWNGSTFTAFHNVTAYPSLYFMNYPAYDIRHLKYQDQAVTLKPGEKLAILITNLSAESRNVLTWEDTHHFGAFFRYEAVNPVPPTTPSPTPSPTPTGGGLIIPPTPTEEKDEETPTPTSTPSPVKSPELTPPPSTPGVTSLSGLINPATGRFMFKISIISDDGKARLEIPAGATGRQTSGTFLTQISITRVDNPGGSAPASANFRAGSYFYKFEPEGATFEDSGSGRVLITLPYDPAPGYEPFIAFWDKSAVPPSWNAINPPFTLNADNTVSGYIDHFTIFAALGLQNTPATSTTSLSIGSSHTTMPAVESPAPTGTVAEMTPAVTPTAQNNLNQPANNVVMAGIIIASLAVAIVLTLIIKKRAKR
ncbi:MAG TPA: hypothetical protein VLH15_01960 [Dehalococcoidales bacterium]|nr:hypothetical protein [Dehalococcoidales bacterium]